MRHISIVILVALLGACGGEQTSQDASEAVATITHGAVDDVRLRSAAGSGEDWPAHGRTWSEQRYSPLASIHADNVAGLQRRWSFATGTSRGLEATPIVVDGTMYATGTWSVVWALDARSGALLWEYDPQVLREVGARACCDVVNRGVAVYRGRVYVGTLDGRLVALNAADGSLVWEVQTTDPERNQTITGAPRVLEGMVIIGNGGAEFGVRGYVSAYAADSGALVWRTYTVPGDPSQPMESDALAAAVDTWSGEWWKGGGGGTVWDSMAYDPQLGLLYVGTGNGSPWVRELRSPGGGDNLYLSSILALDPKDGHLVWHHQTTPGDTWDFTATQHIILADLEIDGARRKTLLQAPKNGFFYVLDRETGEFLSGEPFVGVTWASGLDTKGRPIEAPGQDFRDGLRFVQPTFFGGHNWQPMSFSPDTGLVYIPAQEVLGAYLRDDKFRRSERGFNLGTEMNVFAAFPPEAASGHLLAWDPVRQREAWRIPHGLPWNGGVLSTAGNLVFQGTADGRFVAYRADDGWPLWVDHTETGVIAAPISYAIDGVQYVSVLAGWGGAFALIGGAAARGAARGPGVLLTYALPQSAPTPEALQAFVTRPGPLADGERLYHRWCARCHGAGAVSASSLPDLREAAVRMGDDLAAVARDGLPETGMPALGAEFSEEEARLIVGYLQARADQTSFP
jgi:quinohemoprotein ethanol dehydrogenase